MDWLSDIPSETAIRGLVWCVYVAVLLPFLLARYHGRASTALTHALVWMTLFGAIVIGYTYRDEMQAAASRIAGELQPGQPIAVDAPDGERAVRLRRASSGQFEARARVEGAEMTMMVDTGASTVVLRAADAARAGIDVAALSFTIAVDTANGSTFCAPVRLKEISVGGIAYTGVEALVSQPGSLKQSLLGMSFLKRLRSYEVTGDFLTLRS